MYTQGEQLGNPCLLLASDLGSVVEPRQPWQCQGKQSFMHAERKATVLHFRPGLAGRSLMEGSRVRYSHWTLLRQHQGYPFILHLVALSSLLLHGPEPKQLRLAPRQKRLINPCHLLHGSRHGVHVTGPNNFIIGAL